MIQADQPHCLESTVIAAVSSKDDGQMQLGWNEPPDVVIKNRSVFLDSVGLSVDEAVLVRIQYGKGKSYDLIHGVGKAQLGQGMRELDGIAVDCLVTTMPGVALFLPVADCIATIVHDPVRGVLALAHLGRHSTVANLAEKLVGYLEDQCQSNPADLIVWMSPSIQMPDYILKQADFALENPAWQPYCTPLTGGFSLDMQGYNQSRFTAAGVQPENITISSINTAKDSNYWSHYTERTVKNKPAPPRFGVVCSLV